MIGPQSAAAREPAGADILAVAARGSIWMATSAAAATGPEFEDIYFYVRDGLRLHARRYFAHGVDVRRRPVICLAGLTRNGRDFHDLALALARDPKGGRTVYTLDYRGRGLSDHDPDWKNYSIPIEMLDVIDFITMLGLCEPTVIGMSRGGLISMVLAAVQPSAIGALVLNDIGPVIEQAGLARISGYVGRTPLPATWSDAAKLVRDLSKRQFPNISDDVWGDVARQLFNEHKGRPAPGYDSKLANALSVFDGPIPALWPQFEAVKRVPVLVLRGANSDILSAATVDEMRRRHPSLAAHVVPDQGHAPLLKDAPTISVIARFLDAADAGQPLGELLLAS